LFVAATRESFDLLKIGDRWFCERCRPAGQKRAPRIVAASPLAALSEFERLLEAEGTRFEEALVEDRDGRLADFKAYSGEVARGLAEVRKALAPQKPPPSLDGAPKSRRPPKKIKANERRGDGQQDWVAGDAQPASEDAP
jgi:hypothetical protein